ncbi:hypothetical protein [Ectobacillus funiculus]|uniref:Uncharacterized protein n=1 Tax=Ectobacillus funiculus TaxID=137993 RepID=A0ABV5WIN6_9BACI
MDQNNYANFWLGQLFGQHSLLDHKGQGKRVIPINLSGEERRERVLQTDKKILVQCKDKQTRRWVTEYKISKIAPISYTSCLIM